MVKLSRNNYLKLLKKKKLKISEIIKKSSSLGKKLRAADIDGDGYVQGNSEMNILWNKLDTFDSDGSSYSVRYSNNGKLTRAGRYAEEILKHAKDENQLSESGSTLSKSDFLRFVGAKEISVRSSNGQSGMIRKAIDGADLNRDGFIHGAKEMNALWKEIDARDHNGDKNSIARLIGNQESASEKIAAFSLGNAQNKDSTPPSPTQSTMTKRAFLNKYRDKEFNVKDIARATQAIRKAFQKADLNRDGFVHGQKEKTALFKEIDRKDKNGSSNSFVRFKNGKTTTAGKMENRAEMIARTATVQRPDRQTSKRVIKASISRTKNVGKRNQMVEGSMVVNGHRYKFRSGGYGKGSAPKGTYTLKAHRWDRQDNKGMIVGGVGFSVAMSDKYDPRVGATRNLLRIHPDGRSAGTNGCIGIVGNAAVQRRFREDMRIALRTNGGSMKLQLG